MTFATSREGCPLPRPEIAQPPIPPWAGQERQGKAIRRPGNPADGGTIRGSRLPDCLVAQLPPNHGDPGTQRWRWVIMAVHFFFGSGFTPPKVCVRNTNASGSSPGVPDRADRRTRHGDHSRGPGVIIQYEGYWQGIEERVRHGRSTPVTRRKRPLPTRRSRA
jgi:hypothetical protein